MIRTLLVLSFLGSACAQTHPDFTGVWELNKAKTTFSRQPPDSMMIKIDHQGPVFTATLRVSARGEAQQQTHRYIIGPELSKNEMHGAPMTSQVEWDGDSLVVHSTATIMGKELRLTDRWTLSGDGNTLIFRQKHRYGTEAEGEELNVFDRRPAEAWQPDAPPKAAEEVYKNIQIMKGVPAPRLRTVMMNLTRWLGVECAYCHVMGEFEKDDRPAKQTARKMFLMVRSINQDHFPASNAVTCWTCHRGQAKPQSLPAQ